MDSFLHVSTNLDQEGTIIFLQSDVGVDDNDKVTTSKVQAGARKEFARLPIGRQQRKRVQLSKATNSTPEGDGGVFTFRRKLISLCFALSICLVFFSCCVFSVLSEKQIKEARIIFTQGCESGWDANQIR